MDKNEALKLTDAQKRALCGIFTGDGYQVVLDVMEEFCNRGENELIGLVPGDASAVIAQHAIVHAQRIFFQRVVSFIDHTVAEETGNKKDNSRFPQALVAQLMSALPMTEMQD